MRAKADISRICAAGPKAILRELFGDWAQVNVIHADFALTTSDAPLGRAWSRITPQQIR